MSVGRIARSADFERVLAHRPCCRSAHFAAHHLAARPLPRRTSPFTYGANKLSTDAAPSCLQPVDESPPQGLWVGCVVPKRHARRAVTRNMIKRAIDACAGSVSARLPTGLWVLRLRSPFDRQRYPSATSPALRQAVIEELRRLLEACIVAAGPACVGEPAR